MLYNGVFRCHGNVILIDACFCKVHSTGPINVCTNCDIDRYKLHEFRKHVQIICFL